MTPPPSLAPGPPAPPRAPPTPPPPQPLRSRPPRRLPVHGQSGAPLREELLAGGRGVGKPQQRLAVVAESDVRREVRYPPREVVRAVQRVDDPDPPPARGLTGGLLRQHRGVRVLLSQQGQDSALRRQVRL